MIQMVSFRRNANSVTFRVRFCFQLVASGGVSVGIVGSCLGRSGFYRSTQSIRNETLACLRRTPLYSHRLRASA